MIYNKLTTERFNSDMNRITNFGMENPEMKVIIDVMNKKIEQFNEMLLKCGNFNTGISDWFLHWYKSETHLKGGGMTWNFSQFIGLTDINGDFLGIDYDKMDYYNIRPDIFCLEFSLSITIPYFKGSNLDIPNQNRIKFDSGSSWDLYLIYPKLDRFKSEKESFSRINFTTSLTDIPHMFDIDDLSKTYILCKFEEYNNFYMKLNKIIEFQGGKHNG